MNNISSYITEKLKINKKVSSSVFKLMSADLNDYFQNKLSLVTQEYILMFCNSEGDCVPNYDENNIKSFIIYVHKHHITDDEYKTIYDIVNKLKKIKDEKRIGKTIKFNF